jgi:hypothetical protein
VSVGRAKSASLKNAQTRQKGTKHSRSSSTMKTAAMPLAPSATDTRLSEVREQDIAFTLDVVDYHRFVNVNTASCIKSTVASTV